MNNNKYYFEFHGGNLNGCKLTQQQANFFCDGRTEDLSEIRRRGGCVHRPELDNQPTFTGYLGPMWDGERVMGTDGKFHYTFDNFTPAEPHQSIYVLRYETQEVYDMLSR